MSGQVDTGRRSLASLREAVAFGVHWFIYLRWVAVLGQFFTVLIVRYGFDLPLQIVPLLATISLTAFSNLILTIWHLRQRLSDRTGTNWREWPIILAFVMAVDLLLLTCLLYYSGGPSNPFWIFFMVNLCLAGVELAPFVAWLLNFLSIFLFAFLLYDHQPLGLDRLDVLLPSIRQTGELTLSHNGVFCAYVTCASVIVFFTTLVTSKLRKQAEELRILDARRIRSEKMEALGTLAAGAAHELSTPLGTIAVVVGELQHELKQTVENKQLLEDMQLIKTELDRCRAILNHMSARAGEGTVENKIDVSGSELLEMLMEGVRHSERVANSITPQAAQAVVHIEPYVTAQALRGMIKNAIEASPEQTVVSLHLDLTDHYLCLRISDQGTGMPEHVLSRIGEPFFTTKPTGRGMGLGIFLARTLVERLGGEMQVLSEPGKGTTVRCFLPARLLEKT